MACFVVSAVEAVIVTAVGKAVEKKEQQALETGIEPVEEWEGKVPFSRKLKWLSSMLWGGVVLLAFEHLWHGEIAPWFPFLTAMSNPKEAVEMLHEMATVGVSMAALITAAWAGMCVAADAIMKHPVKEHSAEKLTKTM